MIFYKNVVLYEEKKKRIGQYLIISLSRHTLLQTEIFSSLCTWESVPSCELYKVYNKGFKVQFGRRILHRNLFATRNAAVSLYKLKTV